MSVSRTIIREKIISDCAALFNQRGYLHIGIPEIETVTGQTKAVLYGYFENRFAMSKAVLSYNLTRQRDIIRQVSELRENYLDKLLAHLDAYDPGKGHFPGGCPVLNAAIETDDTNEELRQMAAAGLQKWNEDIEALIYAGIKNGELRPKQGAPELAWLLISIISGAVFAGQALQNATLTQQLLTKGKATIKKLL